jgi:hypothetical protein
LPRATRTAAVACIFVGGALAAGSAAPVGEEAEWPCEQRYVPELSAGTIWVGPPLDELSTPWYENEAARDIVYGVSAEGLEPEEGVAMIDEFAATLGPERNEVLTQLFAGLFDKFNTQRSRMLRGIKNFFRRQQNLVKQINSVENEIRELEEAGVAKDDKGLLDLNSQLTWNVRVYDERQKLTVYVCEEPVLLEQKLGVFARAIQAHLEG